VRARPRYFVQQVIGVAMPERIRSEEIRPEKIDQTTGQTTGKSRK